MIEMLNKYDFQSQLHLWTVAAHIVLVYVQNGCVTLCGIISTIHGKVKAR